MSWNFLMINPDMGNNMNVKNAMQIQCLVTNLKRLNQFHNVLLFYFIVSNKKWKHKGEISSLVCCKGYRCVNGLIRMTLRKRIKATESIIPRIVSKSE